MSLLGRVNKINLENFVGCMWWVLNKFLGISGYYFNLSVTFILYGSLYGTCV